MSESNLELLLLCGVLDALPFPAILLGRRGKPAYVNGSAEALGLSGLDFNSIPEAADCLAGVSLPGVSRTFPGQIGSGTLEMYPVRSEAQILGALMLFKPEKEASVLHFDALPTASSAMDRVWERIRRLSALGTVALFIGEPGVGKESFARALHRMSPQARHPFSVLSALSADTEDLKNAAASAGEGTLFIDGAESMQPAVQEALLQLLNDKAESRGGLRARLMLAALPELNVKVRDGAFSGALYQRIQLMPVFIPPLRERTEDILSAAGVFLQQQAELLGRDLQGFSPDARAALLTNRWVGNLAALREAVCQAAAECPSGLILASHLPGEKRGDLQEMTKSFTKERIIALMDVYGHGVEGKRAVAKELGIGLSTLYRLLAK